MVFEDPILNQIPKNATCETCIHRELSHELGPKALFDHPHPHSAICMIMCCLIIDGKQCGGMYYESVE